ncbi:MAG: hypothetical protein ACYC4P_15390 [Thermoanaerobaculia bacterium]
MRRGPSDLLLAVGVFVAAFVTLYAGRSYSFAGDTIPAERLPLALLRNGGPDFRGLVPSDPGQAHGFAVRGERVVSVYPLVAGFLHVPVVFAAHTAGFDVAERHVGLARLTAAWVSAAATAAFFLALAPLVARRTAFFFSAVFLLGTEVFSVAGRGLWQHGPALLFVNCALALLVRGGRFVPWAGMALGLAVASRPTTLLLAGALTVFVALRHRDRLVAFISLAALPAAAVTAYSAAWLGSPFALGQLLTTGFFGGFRFDALLGLLFSPSRGLFVFSPVLLLGIVGLARVEGDPVRRDLVRAAASFFPALLLLTSFWPSWWGGHSFGYRILSEVVPVLLLPAALAWETRGRLFRAIGIGLAIASLGAHSLGAYVPGNFNFVPDDIDSRPSRLWDVRDSDLARRARVVLRWRSAAAHGTVSFSVPGGRWAHVPGANRAPVDSALFDQEPRSDGSDGALARPHT